MSTYKILEEDPRGPLDQEAVDRMREAGLEECAELAQGYVDSNERRRNRWYRRIWRYVT